VNKHRQTHSLLLHPVLSAPFPILFAVVFFAAGLK